MDLVDQIFGPALDRTERERTAPQGADAVTSPSPAIQTGSSLSEDKPLVTAPMSQMASLVLSAWDTNVSERDSSGVTERLQYAFDVHTCHFTQESIRAMAEHGIKDFVAKKLCAPITFSKNRALHSLMDDMLNSVSEPIFTVEASPLPDVSKRVDTLTMRSVEQKFEPLKAALMQRFGDEPMPPQMEAELVQLYYDAAVAFRDKILDARRKHAKVRAERMQTKVWDMMVEGGWERENVLCMDDFCVFGTAFMVGPVPRAVVANHCEEDEDGVVKYIRKCVVKPVYERLNPMDCYPAPDALEPGDGPFCVRVKYSGETLWRFCESVPSAKEGGEGWNAAVIRDILERFPNGGVKMWLHTESQEKRTNEGRSSSSVEDCTYEAVRCFMPVRGSVLAEIGIVKNRDGKKIKFNDFYHVEVIVLDGKCIYCRIMDSRSPVPISKAVCYAVPGAFWGESLADKMKLAQTMLNNIAKGMFINLMAAGPMYWVDYARLHDKNEFKVRPWNVITFDAPAFGSQSTGAPIGVLQSQTIQPELVQAWNTWVGQADNDSGIPRFAEGTTGSQLGALRTSGGLQQMTEHMMRGSKALLRRYDDGIVRNSAQLSAEWVLMNDDDMTLKGDVTIRCVGLLGRLSRSMREQSRIQALQLLSTNQYLQQIFPPDVAVALFRPHLRELEVGADDFPSEEEMAWTKQLMQIAQLAAAAKGEQEVSAAQQQAGATGMQPGTPPIEQPAAPQGAVAERRSVA